MRFVGSWAHPRACGENLENPTACFPVQGSSPRMRGKPVALSESIGSGRLIPAHAGKTRATVSNQPGM